MGLSVCDPSEIVQIQAGTKNRCTAKTYYLEPAVYLKKTATGTLEMIIGIIFRGSSGITSWMITSTITVVFMFQQKVLVQRTPGKWAVVLLTRELAEQEVAFVIDLPNLEQLEKVHRVEQNFILRPVSSQWYPADATKGLMEWCFHSGMTNSQFKSLKLMMCQPDGIGYRLYDIEFDWITPSVLWITYDDKLNEFSKDYQKLVDQGLGKLHFAVD